MAERMNRDLDLTFCLEKRMYSGYLKIGPTRSSQLATTAQARCGGVRIGTASKSDRGGGAGSTYWFLEENSPPRGGDTGSRVPPPATGGARWPEAGTL